ncbi:hypothetical protein J4G37_35545, partial [Microvirga sp. 3-52]|nr:hypothetical protein [Microvirga sp. 3-52]
MKKILRFSLLLLLMFSLVALAACTNSDSSKEEEKPDTDATDDEKSDDGKVEIEFWHAMSGSGQESLDSIVNGFNESQDKYTVNAEFQGTYEESLTKLR